MSTPIFELCNAPHDALLARVKANLPVLEALSQELAEAEAAGMMRFYNSRMEVYRLWPPVERAAALFRKISPSGELALPFEIIVQSAADHRIDRGTSRAWIMGALPAITALHHCRFLVDEHVWAGRELERAPDVPAAGWSALLGLYGLQ
jgi:hypothetical protein